MICFAYVAKIMPDFRTVLSYSLTARHLICVIDKAGPNWNWSELNSETKKRATGNTVCADCMCVGAAAPCWETVSRSQFDAAVMLRHSAGSQLHLFHSLNWSSTISAVIQSRQDAFVPHAAVTSSLTHFRFIFYTHCKTESHLRTSLCCWMITMHSGYIHFFSTQADQRTKYQSAQCF